MAADLRLYMMECGSLKTQVTNYKHDAPVSRVTLRGRV